MPPKPLPSSQRKRPRTIALTDSEWADLQTLARRLKVSRGVVVVMMLRAGVLERKQGESLNER